MWAYHAADRGFGILTVDEEADTTTNSYVSEIYILLVEGPQTGFAMAAYA